MQPTCIHCGAGQCPVPVLCYLSLEKARSSYTNSMSKGCLEVTCRRVGVHGHVCFSTYIMWAVLPVHSIVVSERVGQQWEERQEPHNTLSLPEQVDQAIPTHLLTASSSNCSLSCCSCCL
jgi:hypothetical protein